MKRLVTSIPGLQSDTDVVSSSLAVDQVTPSSDVESLSRERMPVGDNVEPVCLSASPITSQLLRSESAPNSIDPQSLLRMLSPMGDDVEPVHFSASPPTSQTTQLQSQSLNSDVESVSVPSNSQVVNTQPMDILGIPCVSSPSVSHLSPAHDQSLALEGELLHDTKFWQKINLSK